MKKLLTLLLIIMTLFFSAQANAQIESNKILIDSTGFTLNNEKIELPIEIENLEKHFGEPNRIIKLKNDIAVWDNIGIIGYMENNSDTVNALNISLKLGKFDFSPENVYKGVIKIDSTLISDTTSFQDLKNNRFIVNPYSDRIWDLEIGKLLLISMLDEDLKSLIEIMIENN
ncbi:DUF7738 domain-containing protein [Constantimarinum furrinae]|uniref:DUF7738 domain-containing protein n=1 Tax=Constantimarinum furrinae TaxID=2562285 RepID=A0A7G8PUX8_9FLAO|nr:hypothetical protein [Constantimarinum furrinae]QNJ98144.1 hypothetical protein ALE3EI_1587 [Constantimarinum furrinae]